MVDESRCPAAGERRRRVVLDPVDTQHVGLGLPMGPGWRRRVGFLAAECRATEPGEANKGNRRGDGKWSAKVHWNPFPRDLSRSVEHRSIRYDISYPAY